jgi:Ulp1 protease family, C-terminal catalytic domain
MDKPPLPRLKKNNNYLDMPIYDEAVIEENINNKKCSPIFTFENNSCIPIKFLIKMAQTYNENYDDKIGLMEPYDKKYNKEYKIYLLKEFQDRFGNDQTNWIKQEFMKYMSDEYKLTINEYLFIPKGPALNKKEWLSQTQIDNVIKQYEILYDDYHYLSSVPSDHHKLNYYETKNIDFDEYKNIGITRFSMVINTDTHQNGGEHWRMLYFDTKTGDIFFIDSVGSNPIKNDLEFINKIKKYLTDNNIPINYKVNKKQHQYGNSNCGPYSIYFTKQFLLGKSFEEITSDIKKDHVMDDFREEIFR